MRTILTILVFLILTQSANADTIVVPAGGNPQSAINAARFGDTIKVEAGATFPTGGAFTGFNLTDKGTPISTARDCGSERILITTTDPSGTPAALFKYPNEKALITTAMAARMPKIVASGSVPAIWINPGAKCWVVERLEITSVPGASTVRLIGFGESDAKSLAEFPDRITFRYNWIKPAEETGQPATAGTANRSAESAFYLEGTRIDIHNNAIQGFVRKYYAHDPTIKDVTHPCGGNDPNDPRDDVICAASAGLLVTTWGDGINLFNNLIQAWTYTWFIGGGSKGIALPDRTGTVSNCDANGCDFSNTAGIVPGKPLAIRVYTYTDTISIFREVWGTARTASVAGTRVTFEKPLCWGDNDPFGNVCIPCTEKNLSQIPADGSPARWDGLQPQNFHAFRNLVDHPIEWGPLMGNNCGGKGYEELKACKGCAIEANIFEGCTGGTRTVRNQGGPDPWNDLDNLLVADNWFKDGNNIFVAYLNDGANLTERSKNVRFINNLMGRIFVNKDDFQYLRVISGVFSGGENTTVSHNTILGADHLAFTSYADEQSRMLGLVNKDNIVFGAPNACFTDGAGVAGAPITSCWPNAQVDHNVLIKSTRPIEDLQASWFQPYPNNFLAQSIESVGFRAANPTGSNNLEDFRLLSTSPYFQKASDGKDIGVDVDRLKQAIFGGGPVPTPSATPVVSPTPVPSPAIQPSPSPISSPSPTPIPGKITLSGSTLWVEGGPMPFVIVRLSDANGVKITETQVPETGAYSFSVAPGSYQLTVEQGGYSDTPGRIYVTTTVNQAGLNFTLNPENWKPDGAPRCIPESPCPPGVVPSPSPTPASTPTPPSPSPSPIPSPTPTPAPSPRATKLILSPLTIEVEQGQTAQAQATVFDQFGQTMNVTVQWLSLPADPTCISVTDGLITGLLPGTCNVGAFTMADASTMIFQETPITVTVTATNRVLFEWAKFEWPATETQRLLRMIDLGNRGFGMCMSPVKETAGEFIYCARVK